jgi:hypothetical protein
LSRKVGKEEGAYRLSRKIGKEEGTYRLSRKVGKEEGAYRLSQKVGKEEGAYRLSRKVSKEEETYRLARKVGNNNVTTQKNAVLIYFCGGSLKSHMFIINNTTMMNHMNVLTSASFLPFDHYPTIRRCMVSNADSVLE